MSEFKLKTRVVSLHSWRTMDTAPKDGTPILAWDGQDLKDGWGSIAVIRWYQYSPHNKPRWYVYDPGAYSADGEYIPDVWFWKHFDLPTAKDLPEKAA